MNKQTLFVSLTAAVMLCACQSSKVKISGRIVGNDAKNVYLEQVSPLSQSVIDSAVLDKEGNYRFELKGVTRTPSLYNIIYNGERIPLFLAGGDRLSVNSVGSFIRNYTVEGSKETELLRQGVKTKTGRSFTRFSIKSILQNPVYLIADKDAYQYFVDNEAELFSPESDFDGVRGVLAYNRSDQEKGRATVYNPISEWIVSVGEHPGIISSNRWIRVQESLERNRSKSYHASRGNEALLTGLLWCSCGSRMYPKVTGRKTADGRGVFPYMCKLKERSRRELCSVSNANGNLLDAAICEQVKHLADHSSDFMKQLEKARSAHAGNRSECETKLSALRKAQAETQRKITALIDSLADFGDSTAAVHLKKRIEELNAQDATLSSRIRELESLTDNGVLGGIEFDVMRQLLTVFHNNIDDMTVTQKRAAIRTVVRKVVWDGKVAHVVLFGSLEDEIDWTTFPVDPEEDDNAPEGGGDGSDSPSGVRWGEDSKRAPDALPAGAEERPHPLASGDS